ncbi:PAS domain-containing sensor histidine kinase [Aestuariispira ectoiniformans]|uniref:PAS domain-containing sensor histidine kinase n=1 Tax=Aestuariispira ectoiniformans TaxID=2775080 RepID=UPI00223AAC3B|nr:PAS domain-containing hybrid sensor histidine kinase/response regulator [Aestuariispira ectoiniformans]
MPIVVLCHTENRAMLESLQAAAGGDFLFEAWGDRRVGEAVTGNGLDHADAVLIDPDATGPDRFFLQVRERCADIPIFNLCGGSGKVRQAPSEKAGFLPMARPITLSGSDLPQAVDRIRKEVMSRRRRQAAALVLKQESKKIFAARKTTLHQLPVVDQLMEHAPIGILLTREDGVITYANHCAENMFAAPDKTLLDRPIASLFAGRQRKMLAAMFRAGNVPPEEPLDLVFSRQAGELGYATLRIVPVNAHRDATNRMIIIEDVTDKIVARIEAEAHAQTRAEFLASMSHELRTPLNAIIGFGEMMYEGVFGPLDAKYQEYAGHILSSGRHLLEVINDTLDLAKIEAKRVEVDLRDVDIAPLLEETVRYVEPQSNSKGIAITVKLPESPLSFRTDQRLLRQVLINLLSNAVKYTPASGKVTVEVRCPDSRRLSIAVSDTGVGIAEGDFDCILEPFGQVRRNLQIAQEGTGLGLPLAKQLTELLGGTLSISSQVGIGTEVSLFFPLRAA